MKARNLLFFVVLLTLTACSDGGDTTTDTTIDTTTDTDIPVPEVTILFNKLGSVGLTPVKKVGDQWVPACMGDEERIRLDFVLQSTDRNSKESDCSKEDCDLQIRPDEDFIAAKPVSLTGDGALTKEHFEVTSDCLSLHNGTTIASESCEPMPNRQIEGPSVSIEELGFTDHLLGKGRGTPVGVAILIDQSGSTSGLVDPDSCLEGKAGSHDFGTNFSTCASDSNSLRLSAAKNLIQQMNGTDPVIVFSFGENQTPNVGVVCDVPGVDDETNPFLLENCYSTDKSYAIGDAASGTLGAVDKLQGKGGGRSNLWTAVDQVWDYMIEKGETARHIVVITDGPDTCDAESEAFQHCFDIEVMGAGPASQAACTNTQSFVAVRTKIEESVASGKPNSHVSFLHFQSKAYPDIDPRMQQVSCLTGGQYQFLNFNQIAPNGSDRKKALNNATTRLRYTMGGVWSLVADIAALTGDPSSGDAVVNKGATYSLAGSVSMKSSPLKEGESLSSFGTGAGNLDERLHVTRSCVPDPDSGEGDDCGFRCSAQTSTRILPAHGSSCVDGTGVCCVGFCTVGDSFCTEQNPDPPSGMDHSLCP
jgi:hypothetical protein